MQRLQVKLIIILGTAVVVAFSYRRVSLKAILHTHTSTNGDRATQPACTNGDWPRKFVPLPRFL